MEIWKFSLNMEKKVKAQYSYGYEWVSMNTAIYESIYE